jgi:hypothetical protein
MLVLQSAGRVSGTPQFISGDAAGTADSQLEDGAAARAVFWLDGRGAAVGGVLAGSAARGAGHNFQSHGRDRLAADFAQDDLLPLAGVEVVGAGANYETGRIAVIASQAMAVRAKHFADDFLWRLGGAAEEAELAEATDDFGFAADGAPGANVALKFDGKHRRVLEPGASAPRLMSSAGTR